MWSGNTPAGGHVYMPCSAAMTAGLNPTFASGEAQILATRDAEIKGAYVLTMEMWHQETVALIEAGRDAGVFRSGDPAASIAWRLIGLVCGLDGIYLLNMPEMDDAAFNNHLDKLISLELF